MKYKWVLNKEENFEKEFLDIAFNSKIIATLLKNRGITSVAKAKEYLYPDFYLESRPEEIPHLIKARDRIIKAINIKEKITIFGDYDVDGVTSTSCLLLTLNQLTEYVDYYIPSRLNEGYGLNKKAIEKLAKTNKTKLLITCDCGISNHDEIQYANSLGVDVIVTDHHLVPKLLPPAHAVLNPRLLPQDHKLHNLPGVGIAYKLAEALIEARSKEAGKQRKNILKKEDLLDLVTLGMIADLAPLAHENRYLVQIGLPKLASTNKVGLQELLRICGVKKEVSSDHVGFGIAPRLNAVGRLTDASLAVKLLTTTNLLEACQIATELDIQNRERQMLCEQTLNEALEMIRKQRDKCIVLAKEGWHHGVIGIVASRLVEKFNLPTILIAIEKDEEIARGSGRSINSLNITETLSLCSSSLEKFGGHRAACGLAIKKENIERFILNFKEIVEHSLTSKDLEPVLKIDYMLSFSELNTDLINKINMLAPFGLGNPVPRFESSEVEIAGAKTIGKDGKHLKLLLKEEIRGVRCEVREALIWNHENNYNFNIGDKIRIAYTPKLNNYNGETFIQLEVKDWEVVQSKDTRKQGGEEKPVIELYDYRERTQECLGLFSNLTSVIYFAEVLQKGFLPLSTHSRNKMKTCENLVFLEVPPDEQTFIDVIKKADPNKIYLAFKRDERQEMNADYIMQRLMGMLKYVSNNKNSKISQNELCSALGINNTTLLYGLETLARTSFISYKKESDEISLKIMTPSRQNFSSLVEYNLFVSEINKINDFRNCLLSEDLGEIRDKVLTGIQKVLS